MIYNIYPQYNSKGTKFSKNKQPCWKSVYLDGPSPSNSHDYIVNAVDNNIIYGEITILRTWFSSNGLCIIGFEQIGNRIIHQEWWCVPSQEKK